MPTRAAAMMVSLALLCASTTAVARPMKVSVFEANAHAEPDPTSQVIEVLFESRELSVSEQETNGWVRVRLSDDTTAWGRLDELASARPTQTVLRRPEAAQPTAAPDRIYVVGLDRLALLVSDDPVVAPMARDLVSHDNIGTAIRWGVGLLGVALIVLALPAMDDDDDVDDDGLITFSASWGLMLAGSAVVISSYAIGESLRPTLDDVTGVVDTWNRRHPEKPFHVDR